MPQAHVADGTVVMGGGAWEKAVLFQWFDPHDSCEAFASYTASNSEMQVSCAHLPVQIQGLSVASLKGL